ncbi:hypothetical protein EIP86_005269 [Pleurotus ostreatoroseus]|nr:hypothetical protein EIP86_005269 [Pleurotus ostreatoroseus]
MVSPYDAYDPKSVTTSPDAVGADPPIPLDVPKVALDPQHPLSIGAQPITIPIPTYRLNLLLELRKSEHADENYDQEDRAILSHDVIRRGDQIVRRVVEDWTHDHEWVAQCVGLMLPAPVDASRMATTALQKELTAMLKEQESAESLRELGWYMPPSFMNDNLFQWIVELHSFDIELPIAKDLSARRVKVNSLVFEIRFPDNYPHSPPFFRLLKPRFLPFAQGGGGHVTAGGSMCMDLLTADGQ